MQMCMLIAQGSKVFDGDPKVFIPAPDSLMRVVCNDFSDRIPQPMNTMWLLDSNVGTGKQVLMHSVPTESQKLVQFITRNGIRTHTVVVGFQKQTELDNWRLYLFSAI